jgi:hypothetical protein
MDDGAAAILVRGLRKTYRDNVTVDGVDLPLDNQA